MGKILLLAALGLLCGVCLGQMPPREELTAQPKYLEGSAREFKSFTEAQLRGEIAIIAGRSHAVFGYNTPEVRIKLPSATNSSYATIEFSEPKLLNELGKAVRYELEHGVYDPKKFSDEIRFRVPDSDAVVKFTHARGTVKVKYPLSVGTLELKPNTPEAKQLALTIDGPFVRFAQDTLQVPESSNDDNLKPVRAYDSEGRLLERYSMTEWITDDDGNSVTSMAFYGNVARIEVDTVEQWAELDLPYDLKPAPLLPAGHEGEDPEGPRN